MFNLPVLQMLIDIALLVALVVLIWRVNANLKKPLWQARQEIIREIKEIMADSQALSENFLQKLEQSRLALKEIALDLEIKEQRVKALLEKSDKPPTAVAEKQKAAAPADKNQQVIEMIGQGYSEAETAEASGLTEAEVGLILDIYRVKNGHV